MRIDEIEGVKSRQPQQLAMELMSKLGRLVRVGGNRRLYQVCEDNHVAAVYSVDGTTKAFALDWAHGSSSVSTIYVWNEFSINHSPDFALDISPKGDITQSIDEIAAWIKTPSTGAITEGAITEMASRTTDAEFMQMARDMFPDRANKLTMVDLTSVATQNDVQIPGSIRSNPNLKVDAHHWNLSGGEGETAPEDNKKLGAALGGAVEPAAAAELDPAYSDVMTLAKAKTVNKLAAAGKVYLMGRKANGAFFKIPGMETITAQLERLLTRQLADGGANGDRMGMEEQYEMLSDKVQLVASGDSAFIKSLLITGAPSSGKSFAVMQKLKEMGLVAGKDFVVKKGRITTVAMYRTLIEQVDGMILFDDCDSVVADKNAVNMLKGALDTDPIREISYDVRGTMQTANLDPEYRQKMVEAMSRILRNRAEPGDLDYFARYLNSDDGEGGEDDEEFIDIDTPSEDDGKPKSYSQQELFRAQKYLTAHLPNKIDFKGRIIFISNMDESEWDSAILTRAFTVNMNFSSSEMLDYIDKIKGHLKAPNITDEQKQEVMDYLRELYTTGKLKRQVNFRLVQQAFDLRLTSNWRKLISML